MMEDQARRRRRKAPGSGASGSAPAADYGACLCGGLGPALTRAVRGLEVPEEVRRQWQATEREALRLLRALIDMRLASIDREAPSDAAPPRGTSVPVE